jgi:hypothetical protein
MAQKNIQYKYGILVNKFDLSCYYDCENQELQDKYQMGLFNWLLGTDKKKKVT